MGRTIHGSEGFEYAYLFGEQSSHLIEMQEVTGVGKSGYLFEVGSDQHSCDFLSDFYSYLWSQEGPSRAEDVIFHGDIQLFQDLPHYIRPSFQAFSEEHKDHIEFLLEWFEEPVDWVLLVGKGAYFLEKSEVPLLLDWLHTQLPKELQFSLAEAESFEKDEYEDLVPTSPKVKKALEVLNKQGHIEKRAHERGSYESYIAYLPHLACHILLHSCWSDVGVWCFCDRDEIASEKIWVRTPEAMKREEVTSQVRRQFQESSVEWDLWMSAVLLNLVFNFTKTAEELLTEALQIEQRDPVVEITYLYSKIDSWVECLFGPAEEEHFYSVVRRVLAKPDCEQTMDMFREQVEAVKGTIDSHYWGLGKEMLSFESSHQFALFLWAGFDKEVATTQGKLEVLKASLSLSVENNSLVEAWIKELSESDSLI